LKPETSLKYAKGLVDKFKAELYAQHLVKNRTYRLGKVQRRAKGS
jgi:hypothetical protein